MKKSTNQIQYALAPHLGPIAAGVGSVVKDIVEQAGIDVVVEDSIAIAIFVMPLDDPDPHARSQYVSTCRREDMIRVLKRSIEFWENGAPDIDVREVN